MMDVNAFIDVGANDSRFTFYRDDGRKRIYRRGGERFTDACVMENGSFCDGSVMLWGGIARGLKRLKLWSTET